MDFDARIPIYFQIIEKIKKEIILGKLQRGEKLPSVRSMASELKVNVNTMQRVYQELEREGITFTQRGTGSFVTEDNGMIQKIKDDMAQGLIKSFVEGMKELGFDREGIIENVNEYIEEA
ncbi:GntR family transcriptional regulator [Marinisporobacter balticus]|uniref:GntR family transcriptional regulator n=1 Tax=Marinisporobacter balticus TaxID=2018667 RepID=A0A4R2KL70_9FIRM|nr:GntR family transcriptional regulator [Marinisporobacter balticus]TCO74781.1 GntR family transcriptional regulator [Marinisporobacter balticus]